jgi:aspartate racemase
MKTLGLLGGLSWVSTLEYYRLVNEGANARRGGLDYAECVVYSLDFGELQRRGWDDWDHTLQLLVRGGGRLKAGGAEAIVLCAVTAHALADEVEARVGLLGTRFTMELPFLRDRLRARGIDTVVPDEPTRQFVQRTLRDEFGRGVTTPATKAAYLDIIDGLVARGAQGIVFACTELPLLLAQDDVAMPVFDVTHLHAAAAVNFALG